MEINFSPEELALFRSYLKEAKCLPNCCSIPTGNPDHCDCGRRQLEETLT